MSDSTHEDSLRRELEEARARVRALEAEHDETRALLDAVVNTIPSPVYVKDREHRLVYVNEAYAGLVGRTRAELVGRPARESLPAENESIRAHDEAFFETAENFAEEERFVDHAGDAHIISTQRALYDDPGGRALQICAMRDITRERVRLNEALSLLDGIDEVISARSRELSRANDLLRKQNEYLGALHETGLGLLRQLEPESLLSALVARAGQLVDTAHGFLYLLDEPSGTLRRTIGTGRFEEAAGAQLARGVDVAGAVWARGDTIVVDDYPNWPERIEDADPSLQVVVGLPMFHRGREKSAQVFGGVIGVALERGSARAISPDEVALLERFAQLASIALDNAKLYAAAEDARIAAERANKAKSVFLANMSH
ncbi:MAG: PAS domain-containing protein, partial [Myxococcales bacterium]|nr:PAS domain-containing protein [Myxococcales bacterium]